jgi:hypothetical protein
MVDEATQFWKQSESSSDETARWKSELAAKRQEIKRLTDAIASGDPADSLLEGIREREAWCRDLLARMNAAERSPMRRVDAILAEVPARVEEWRTILREHDDVNDARRVLQGFLIGKLNCEPRGTGKRRYYEYSETGNLRGWLSTYFGVPNRTRPLR